jgi:chemotaxis protein MotA
MDKLSILGMLVALAGIIGGQVLEGGTASFLLQSTAFLVVFGGTLGAVMLQCPLNVFLAGIKLGRWAFMPPQLSGQETIRHIVAWGNVARKEGVLALEDYMRGVHDPYVRRGLQLLVENTSAERIREALEVEIGVYERQHFSAARVWESAAGYSPTIGIMGAVLGLIHVMQNLANPTMLGDGIAVAFIATIYGVGFANLVFLPIANKIKILVQEQVAQRVMIAEGLACIANNENPRFIESKLRGYLLVKV